MLSVIGSITTAAILTLIVLFESLYFVPWSPYFIVYAFLAIVIPIKLGTYRFGSFSGEFKRNLRPFIIFLVIAILYAIVMDTIYDLAITAINAKGNTMIDFNAALSLLAEKAGEKFHITTENAKLIYAIYILIWAPIGEELFYRGYLYTVIKEKTNTNVGIVVSSFFFGIRHTTHFFFLTPTPILPGLWWATHAFFFGVIMAYIYEKTNTLYVPMIIHFIANLI